MSNERRCVIITNINSVNVELRQWLYNHGDQCVWNTGGWIKCYSKFTPYSNGYSTSVSVGVGTIDTIFNADIMHLAGTITAPTVTWPSYKSTNYYRGGGKIELCVGTQKPLLTSIQKYKSFHMVEESQNNALSNFEESYSIRVGTANDDNTTTATATILQSGSAIDAELVLGDYKPYFVVGKIAECKTFNGNSDFVSNPGTLNASLSYKVSEIWLE